MTLPTGVLAAESISLQWGAPANCPSKEVVLAEVNRLLGSRASAEQPHLEVFAIVTHPEADVYHVRLDIFGPHGLHTRQVHADSCAALSEAAALILAMMVDPEAAMSASMPANAPAQEIPTSPPPEAPPPPPPPSIAVKPEPVVAQSPAVEKKRPTVRPSKPLSHTRMAVLAHAAMDGGSLPGIAGGFGGALALLPGRLRLDAGFTWFPPRTGNFEALASAGAKIELSVGQLSAGISFAPHSSFEFVPALRAEVGWFRGESFGVTSPGETVVPFVAIGPDGRVFFRATRQVYLFTGIGALVPFTRPIFNTKGLGVLYQPAPLLLRLSGGVEVRW